MSKKSKREKNLLKKFNDIDDETLLNYLIEEIKNFIVLEKSTEKAKEILLKHGITSYGNINEYKINRYNRLLELSKLRNLTIPKSVYEVEITDIDIIFRIEEFLIEETNWIEEHNYLFDLFDLNYPKTKVTNMIPDENTYISDKKIEETIQKYEEIIIKEFGIETKNHYDEKRKEYLNRDLETMYQEVIPIDKIPTMLIRRKQRNGVK